MKKTFPEYALSRRSRNRYNEPVHNASAVLASEQFRRVVSDNSDPVRKMALFLTGVPGAGKTAYFLQGGELPATVRVVYKGQLSNASQAIPKIELALRIGLRPEITAVHIHPEQALRYTLERFDAIGRGASIESMARIQSVLPTGLRAIYRRFGDLVAFRIADRRRTMIVELRGWRHLVQLKSEGSYEEIKQVLNEILDRDHRSGTISNEAYHQALGKVSDVFLG